MKTWALYPILILTLMLGVQNSAHAASISVVADKNTITVGERVGVTVYVSSPTASMNNAEATMLFPSDIIEAASVTQSSSIFNIWVEPPVFSNAAGNGSITFNGGLPTPGYRGTFGTIIRAVFVGKKAGSAPISFSSAVIRANDGLGTDITEAKNGVTLNVISSPPKAPVPATTDVPTQPEPPTPATKEPTHQPAPPEQPPYETLNPQETVMDIAGRIAPTIGALSLSLLFMIGTFLILAHLHKIRRDSRRDLDTVKRDIHTELKKYEDALYTLRRGDMLTDEERSSIARITEKMRDLDDALIDETKRLE